MSKKYNNVWFKFGKYFVLPMVVFSPMVSAFSRTLYKRQPEDLNSLDVEKFDEQYPFLRGGSDSLHQESSSIYNNKMSTENEETVFIELAKKVKESKSQHRLHAKISKKELKNLAKEKEKAQKIELEDSLNQKSFDDQYTIIKNQLLNSQIINVSKDTVLNWLEVLKGQHQDQLNSEEVTMTLCKAENAKLQKSLEDQESLKTSELVAANALLELANIGSTQKPTSLRQCVTQIATKDIFDTLEHVLGAKLPGGLFVEIIRDNSGIKYLKIGGRAAVSGGGGNQMHHVTPISFVVEIIRATIKQDDTESTPKDAFKRMINLLSAFLPEYGVKCLSQEIDADFTDIKSIKTRLDQRKAIKYDILNTNLKSYYIINSCPKSIKWFEDLLAAQKITPELCQSKKLDLIMLTLNYFKENISDTNTLDILSQAIAKFILIFYNKGRDVAFPAEGNSINDEIHLHNLSKISEADGEKIVEDGNFVVLKPYELATPDMLLDKRIRVVDNEGSMVTKAKECLQLLDEIALSGAHDNFFQDASLVFIPEKENPLKKYNDQKCDKPLKLSTESATIAYNNKYQELTSRNKILEKFIYEVVKHLYAALDYKNLEEKVFVPFAALPADVTGELPLYDAIPYTDRSGPFLKYVLVDGERYRKNQIESAEQDGRYGVNVKYRDQAVNDNESIERLANIILKHIDISAQAFLFINFWGLGLRILNEFVELVKIDYGSSSRNTMIINIKDRVEKLRSEKGLFDTENAKFEEETKEETETVKGAVLGNQSKMEIINSDYNDFISVLVGDDNESGTFSCF